MPSQKMIVKKYLDSSILEKMDEVCHDEPTDYVIYAGYEHDDVCYYRPARFSSALLDYLHQRIAALGEIYHPVPSFLSLQLMAFPSIKCFGLPSDAVRVANKMESALGLHVPPVRDPFDGRFMVAQATRSEVSKGNALLEVKRRYNIDTPVITAGNDYNDQSMFEVGSLKIVMGDAPADLLEIADVVAPPASETGIITGLKQALESFR
jgi:hydroxymethylpyrimidine pyrophosphatase-like HAD family hydrolase